MKQPTNGQPTLENTPVKQRGREYATMFAYGVPRRRAVRMIMIESTLIGTLATAVGVAGGMAMLVWFVRSLGSSSMPEIGLDILLSPVSVAIAVAIGIVAVGLAPLLTAPRRLARMDVPFTLRVMKQRNQMRHTSPRSEPHSAWSATSRHAGGLRSTPELRISDPLPTASACPAWIRLQRAHRPMRPGRSNDS